MPEVVLHPQARAELLSAADFYEASRPFNFPYGMIYRVRGETLYVVGVMHLKRKPGYWLARTGSGA
jgi:hypothetical protein